MSYTLKIVVPSVPAYNHEAFAFADELLASSHGIAPSPRMRQLYNLLTARFPCGSTGAYEDGKMGECPWADQPLMQAFTGDVAVITVAARQDELIPFVLRRAGALAMTVIDEQAGKVHRPALFKVLFSGVSNNVITRDLATKLVPLLKRSDDEVLQIISRPGSVMKRRLDHVTAKRFVQTMSLIGCACHIEKETGEGAVLVAPSQGTRTRGVPANEAEMAVEAPAPAPQPQPAAEIKPEEPAGSWVSRTWDRISKT